MTMKIIIVLILLLIMYFLFSGLYYMVRDQGKSDKTARSLTARITISIILFILLVIGYATGLIEPHGLPTVSSEQSEAP